MTTSRALIPEAHPVASATGEPPRPTVEVGRKPTILLALPYAMNVRDVLRTGVFRTLREAGARVVILSPAHDQPRFIEEFGGTDVHFEPLYPDVPGPIRERFETLRFTVFSDLTKTIGMIATPPRERGPLKRAALAGMRVVSRVVGVRRASELLARAGMVLFPNHRYDEILRKYRPDLVCLTRVFGWSADSAVLKGAVRLGIPTVLVVSSWDNLTSKGVFPAPVDRLVVWNSILAEEAVQLHGYAREQVYIAGVPQFDIYADRSKLPDRASFFRRLGGDPAKRLITFALTNPRLCPDEYDIVEMLWKAGREGAFGTPCQILARLHPLATGVGGAFPERLRGLPDLLVDVPGSPSAYVDRDTSLDDMKHLAATMWHSDVVLNTASTVAIDAAAFDTPVVCACFDGQRTLPYERSVRRYHDYTHFKKLLEMGGVRVAYDLPTLIAHINAYLGDPSLEREGRARIVERQCLAIDGKAGERIGRYLLRAAAELRRPS